MVVRCFNEALHLGTLLRSIAEQTVRDLEVIVVDSGWTDGTLAIAESHGARILHIEPARFTFGRSLNVGCAEARGEILVLASAHVYPCERDWIERLMRRCRCTR